jgi:hypothetical protein
MSDDTEGKPPVQLVSERPGVIWRATQLVITAAGECAREFRAGGARPATLELLAIAYEQLGAALDGEIPEPITDGYLDQLRAEHRQLAEESHALVASLGGKELH